MMQWPGHMVYEKPVTTLDILPTIAAACGVSTASARKLDGVDLMPYLTNQKFDTPHEALFWKLAASSAVRVDKWKLYLEPKNGIALLFNLETDPTEKVDLSAQEPEVFADLMARYSEWENSLPPRAWTNISPVFKK
jgi:arylsulfatase A-like enzyme